MPAKPVKPVEEDDLIVAAKSEAVKKAKEEDETSNKSDNEDDSDVDEEGLNWWERENLQASKKGEKRWTTLSHNGPYFEPEYEVHNIPIKYGGQTLTMVPAVEEVATMYAVMRESPYYLNEVFRANFMKSWREVMQKHQPQLRAVVRDLALVDFNAIWNDYVIKRDARKNAPKEVKKQLAEEKKKLTAKYVECIWDGRKEKVANFRVEPPGLFRGRGKHPNMGMLKTRTYPEDITINIGKGEKIPECPPGHKWGSIIHDNTVTWLATWTDNVTNNNKYVMLSPTSMIKGMSDREKFERARRLKAIIGDIRADYIANWNSKSIVDRELGVALYFIDKLALRVGNEKGSDEADTVGCCSLRVEHVSQKENNQIHLDFLGKDSIRYSQTVEVDPRVHKLIGEFTKGKDADTQIFSHIQPQNLNDYLKKHMSDLTAKVFRTYNASICLDELLRKDPPSKDAPESEKLIFFNKCNTEVAILCNHQKAVGKSYFKAVKTNNEKMEYMKNNIARLEALKDRIEEVGRKQALEEFYAVDDKMQNEWLEKYGNDKQKADFIAYVQKRDERRANEKEKTASAASSTAKKEKKAAGDKKKTAGTKRSASAASKAAPKAKKGAKAEKKIDVEEDEDLAALLEKSKKTSAKAEKKPAAAKKAAAKPAAKKAAAAAAKKPAAKAAKKAEKPAAKKAAPKKAGKK